MHRFFIPAQWIDQDRVAIKGKQVHQIRDVLRMRGGEHIVVLDNSGWEYEVEIESVDSGRVRGVVKERRLSTAEPHTKITLYQALLKGEKFELVLQKGTELGVAGFVPMICQRCVAGQLKDVAEGRLSRWQRIITEAAEQSGRGKLPGLGPVMPFHQACQGARGLSLIAYEGERASSLRAALQGRKPLLSIFIGPEGGFSPSEVELARSLGILPVSLGRRVLRAETAGLIAATAVLYEFGDLDPPSDLC